MKLKMGRMEGLEFTLFCKFLMEVLVMYAITNYDGGELRDFLEGMINAMFFNFFILLLMVTYEYVVKSFICKSYIRTTSSSSLATTPDDTFSFQEDALSTNAL